MPVAAVSSTELAYIQGHTRAAVKGQRPRLAQAKENHAKQIPVCTAAPTITGTVTVGSTLTCTAGSWLNAPAMGPYRWRRRGVSAYITGATGSTYQLAAADSGQQIHCEVTAANGAGSTTTMSGFVNVP